MARIKLAVAIIHGIGTQPDQRNDEGQHVFAEGLIAGLRQQLGIEASDVAFQSLYWASVLDNRQYAYLQGLRAKVDADTPLVVLAHSLGGHIFSNFAWDQQRINQAESCPLDPFLALETLSGLITFGCNIPLFTFACDPVIPIRFPGNCLPNAVREQARWLNLYAPADPLGYPLRPLPSYAAVVAEDRAMPVGPWYARHTPLSHLTYWHDKRFQRYIGRYLRQLLSAC